MPATSHRSSGSHSAKLGPIAREASVSQAAAAHVTSGGPAVRPQVHQAAGRAAHGRDYAPGHSTFRRPSVPTNAIAVVTNEAPARSFNGPLFSTMLEAICNAAAERSLLAVMLAPKSPRELELAEAFLLGRHVDGAVLVGLYGNNPLPNRLREHGVPAVLCGQRARGIVASCIDCDNRQGATMAVEHLISLGRRRIATISGDLDMAGAVDRRMGYRDALAAAGIPLDPTLEEVADYLSDRAQMAMERLLLNHSDVDGVFAASDLMAAAAIRVLTKAGKRIPEDVAVVGFDDSPDAVATNPPLTTVRQPPDLMGREAVNILMLELREPREEPREVVCAAELVVRESTVGGAG